jgi:8-oxo-dGTP diphosphatase
MREWSVGGALIRHADGLVLVANRRRDGSLDWTPPGGVIDAGESVLNGLAREVQEETGLVVDGWAGQRYSVVVEAPGMGWKMSVAAWEVAAVSGEIAIADPDGIVEQVRHVSRDEGERLLSGSAAWLRIPIAGWLDGATDASYHFVVDGTDRATATARRIR